MRIRACVKCGSLDLDFMPGDGMAALTRFGIGPVAGIAACRNCGNLSAPIEFKNEEDYKKFLVHLKRLKGKRPGARKRKSK